MMGDYTEHLISMAGGDGGGALDLDAIQAQQEAADNASVTIEGDTLTREYVRELESVADDAAYLLALVREQAAKLEAVELVAADFEARGASIEAQGSNGSIYSIRAEGRGNGYREAAVNIRTALTATDKP